MECWSAWRKCSTTENSFTLRCSVFLPLSKNSAHEATLWTPGGTQCRTSTDPRAPGTPFPCGPAHHHPATTSKNNEAAGWPSAQPLLSPSHHHVLLTASPPGLKRRRPAMLPSWLRRHGVDPNTEAPHHLIRHRRHSHERPTQSGRVGWLVTQSSRLPTETDRKEPQHVPCSCPLRAKPPSSRSAVSPHGSRPPGAFPWSGHSTTTVPLAAAAPAVPASTILPPASRLRSDASPSPSSDRGQLPESPNTEHWKTTTGATRDVPGFHDMDCLLQSRLTTRSPSPRTTPPSPLFGHTVIRNTYTMPWLLSFFDHVRVHTSSLDPEVT